MVVLNRIAYLRRILAHGAKVVINVSSNPNANIEKFKLLIDPGIIVDPAAQQCVLAVPDVIECAANCFHVADRGHKHTSSGISEVTFLVSHGKLGSVGTLEVDGSAIPCGDVTSTAVVSGIPRQPIVADIVDTAQEVDASSVPTQPAAVDLANTCRRVFFQSSGMDIQEYVADESDSNNSSEAQGDAFVGDDGCDAHFEQEESESSDICPSRWDPVFGFGDDGEDEVDDDDPCWWDPVYGFLNHEEADSDDPGQWDPDYYDYLVEEAAGGGTSRTAEEVDLSGFS